MKIYNSPLVTLLARQNFVYPKHINWQSDEREYDSQVLTEFSGRLCYLSFGEDAGIEGHKSIKGRSTNSGYIENILDVAHGSVLEHANWSFLLEGVSRSLTHELVRHRAGFGFSQLSQRFVNESDVAFVRPPLIKPGTRADQEWQGACNLSLSAYRVLLKDLEEDLSTGSGAGLYKGTLKAKRAREAARAVLPNCTETKIVVTGNARAWRHFIEMRGGAGADLEIRMLALSLLRALSLEAPHIFSGYTLGTEPDGNHYIAHSEYNKV